MDNAYLKKTWQKARDALAKQDFRAALALLQKIKKSIPVDADVQFALAEAHAGMGRLPDAIRECRAGVERVPSAPEGWIHLGRLCLATADGYQALEAFNRAIEIQPESIHALVGRAEAHAMLEDFAAAEADLQKALINSPDHAEITIGLARIQDASGDIDRAEDTLRKACESAPNEVSLWLTLGFALRGWDRIEEARAVCQQARALHPESDELIAQGADLAYETRDLDEAIALYRQLLEGNPDNPMIQNDLAQALASIGRTDEAEEIFRMLTGKFPFFTKPWLNIALSKRFEERDPDIKAMLALEKKPQLSQDQGIHLQFALGKAFDDAGKADKAFRFYKKANQQHRKHLDFSIEETRDQITRLIAAFDKDMFSRLREAGSSSRKPLFVLGMPRSGTTLLEQVLCAHSAIATAGELRALAKEARRLATNAQAPWPDCLASTKTEDISEAARHYLTALEAKNDNESKIIDKMPQNFLHAGFAASLFPEAVIVHCRRDPVDTCLSIYFQMFPRGMDFAYDLKELGEYFKCYAGLMAHWKALLGDQLIEVHYENLVSDPSTTLKPLLSALDLPWEDALLSHQDHVGRVDTLSLYQVRQPLHTGSTERWRRYENQLGELIGALD